MPDRIGGPAPALSDVTAAMTAWAQIRRGTFVDDSFDTAVDGRVRDASWEPNTDEQDTAIAYMVYPNTTVQEMD